MATAEEKTDLTQCPVCFEEYSELEDHTPRILPCHCTLCHSCIEQLIKNEQLECPQDRQKHPAKNGVKSFPQNKYVVAYLKKGLKDKGNDYDRCAEHDMKMMLFCEEENCQKPICPLCMSEDHLNHPVANVLKEKKKDLDSKMDPLIDTIKINNAKIEGAKCEVEKKFEDIIKEVSKKKESSLEKLDAKIRENLDNLATLEDMRKQSLEKASYNEVANKLEFVSLLQTSMETSGEDHFTFTSLKLAEVEEKLRIPAGSEEIVQYVQKPKNEKIELTAKKEKQIETSVLKYVISLSDGSILSQNMYGTLTKLRCSFEELWSKRHKLSLGIAEVRLGEKQCLAVSCKAESYKAIRSMAGIDFLYLENIDQTINYFYKEHHYPGFLYTISPAKLLYQNLASLKELWEVECSGNTPTSGKKMVLTAGLELKDMCYRDWVLVCLYENQPGIFAQTTSGERLWYIDAVTIFRHTYVMKCSSVAFHDSGLLMVADQQHNCIRLFNSRGQFLKKLVSVYDLDLIRWSKEKCSLILFCCNNSVYSKTKFRQLAKIIWNIHLSFTHQ